MSTIRILGIETSCDETAFAVLEASSGQPRIVAECISSQVDIHEAYGGVVPELAAREHMRNLPLLLQDVLESASCSLHDIDRLAVTVGPGLKGCLLVGLEFARGLSLAADIPVHGINHIEGHVLAPMLDNEDLEMPYLALVVSGGHSEIVQVDGIGQYTVLTRTIDDAAGEAFDKSASLLDIPYPGGPKLAALADTVSESRFRLPKVMRESDGYSFSGLKTAIRLLVEKHADELDQDAIRAELAFAIQDSIVDALVFKLKKAIKKTGIRTVAITGGVSANSYLRKQVALLPQIRVVVPAMIHCMDNAAMIAYTAYQRRDKLLPVLTGDPVQSRWPIETMPAV